MSDDYEVGYGKPPKRSQFREGQSGNPGGRKPGSKNFTTLVKAALDEKITVKENGKHRRVSRREIIARQLVIRSSGADLKAIAMLIGIIERIESAPAPSARTHTIDDEAVLRGIRKRFEKESDDDAGS